MRDHKLNHNMGIYYICVKRKITSTYSLKVRKFQQVYNLSELEKRLK